MLAPSTAKHEGLESHVSGETRTHPLAGRLEGISVPDLVWEVCREGKTGILRFVRSGVTRSLYFDEGRIVFAASDDPNERLGETLVRDGLVTLDQYEQAVTRLGSGKRLGSLLVEAGHLTTENLVRSVLAQVRGIVLGLFPWEAGEFSFEAGPLPNEEMIQLGVSTGELILQGVRQIRSFTLIRRAVGSARTCYTLVADWRDRLTGIVLADGESLLLERLQEGPRSVEELCQELYLSNFEIYQALWAFRILEVARRVERGAGEETGRSAGRLDQQEFLAILVRLCRERETGVLHATHGAVDRTFHIKEGRCVFATSTSGDDGLVAHLLRRGVISLQDREEVTRRLLTNRRVGTLLLEMGVIDEADLRTAVREQILEIVFDTARWQEGDWAFSPGELPTFEEITLECSLEDLLFQAARKVTSWSRILRGIGGLDAWLALTPKYLEVLDRTSIGGDEWDIVASLGAPRTVRDVCHAHQQGDFRICQMLWALRLLGALAEVPAPIAEPAVAAVRVEPVPTESKPEPEPESPTGPASDRQEIEESGAARQLEHLDAEVDRPDVEPAPATDRVPETQPARPEPEPPPGESIEVREPQTSPEPIVASPDNEAPEDVPESPSLPPVVPAEESPFPLHARMSEVSMRLASPAGDADLGSEEDREIDPDLDRQIARFNACQQIVYRAIRSEVGAGASNFIRFCALRLKDGFNDVFTGVDLTDDGAWETASLRAAVRRKALLDPWLCFQRLLDKELEMVHVHLGGPQAEDLRRRVDEFERAHRT